MDYRSSCWVIFDRGTFKLPRSDMGNRNSGRSFDNTYGKHVALLQDNWK